MHPDARRVVRITAAVALVVTTLASRPVSADSAFGEQWDEGGLYFWGGERRLAPHGSRPAEHAFQFGFIGDVRPSGWPVGVDFGLYAMDAIDFTKGADGIYRPPVHGSNVHELYLGAGRIVPIAGPIHGYAALGLAFLDATFSDTLAVQPPQLSYFGGYTRVALFGRWWKYFELGVGASWVSTPSQWVQVDSRSASGIAWGVFAGAGGRAPRP